MAKGRLFLIHWNAEEAEALAAPLRKDGWDVDIESEGGAQARRRILAGVPDAVLVSLARLPSHGRETVQALKSSKATRDLPIIFVGEPSDAMDKTRTRFRDATFVTEEGLKRVIARYATPEDV